MSETFNTWLRIRWCEYLKHGIIIAEWKVTYSQWKTVLYWIVHRCVRRTWPRSSQTAAIKELLVPQHWRSMAVKDHAPWRTEGRNEGRKEHYAVYHCFIDDQQCTLAVKWTEQLSADDIMSTMNNTKFGAVPLAGAQSNVFLSLCARLIRSTGWLVHQIGWSPRLLAVATNNDPVKIYDFISLLSEAPTSTPASCCYCCCCWWWLWWCAHVEHYLYLDEIPRSLQY